MSVAEDVELECSWGKGIGEVERDIDLGTRAEGQGLAEFGLAGLFKADVVNGGLGMEWDGVD